MREPVSRPRARVAVALAALAAAALALAGCAGIPTSGGVTAGNVIEDDSPPDFQLLPEGPQKNATQEELVTGFLRAAANASNNYEIAKSFLSTGFRDKWDPGAGVSISASSLGTARVDATTLEYSFTTSASVDASGRYSEQTTPSTRTLDFGFVKDAKGQWRIDQAEDGIVLTAATFNAAFSSYPLWYFDPGFHYLVPDLRWFARRSTDSAAASVLVGALLQPVSPWLRGAVLSEFPSGTTLGSNSVTIEAGRATVDLSEQAVGASALQRQRMRQQLFETLRSAFSVSSVVMTADGVGITAPDSGDGGATADTSVPAQPLVLQDGAFGYASDQGIAKLGALSENVAKLAPSAIVVSENRSLAAVLTPVGVQLVQGSGAAPRVLDARPGLVAPSLDADGFVWTVTASGPPVILATGSDGLQHQVDAQLPPDAAITSIAVSRDNSRLLLYFQSNGAPRLVVAGIIRDGSVPTSLAGMLDLPVDSGAPVAAGWVDATTVATIEQDGSPNRVTTFEVGGGHEDLPGADHVRALAGGNGTSGLYALGETTVLEYKGSGWQDTGVAASVLAVQQ